MPPQGDIGPSNKGSSSPHLIRAREDVVVTSSVDPQTSNRTYYVKVTDTGEIFEFGENEYEVWQSFAGGASYDTAASTAAKRFGNGFQDKLRTFVADLAMRGLLGGDLPPDLVDEFERDQQQDLRRHLIDPVERYKQNSWYRLVLMDPDHMFGVLARWLAWVRFLRWPLAIAAALSIMVIFKQAQQYSTDFHGVIAQWGRVPHAVLTLLTLNLTRVIAQGAVSRYYGARVRYLSLDLVYGVWPRFHEDKKGILVLARSPQLWSHATPFFVRLGYFSVGTLGWWWLRGNGSHLSGYCLLLSEAAIADFVTATLPLFKNETYFWFCAFHRDPVLQDRGKAALRSMFFLTKGTPRYLSSVEKLSLALYGISMIMAFLLIILTLITFVTALTGAYYGFGFCIVLILVALGVTKVRTIRALKRSLLEARAMRRAERRSLRTGQAAGRVLEPVG